MCLKYVTLVACISEMSSKILSETKIVFHSPLKCQMDSAPRTSNFFITFIATFSFFLFQNLLKFPPPLNSLVSVVKGEKWRHIRNTLSPSFSALKMKRMVPLMNQACDTFMTKLEKVTNREESIDIHE